MNWIKANRFLAGLLAVVVVGSAVLGWLLWSAMGSAAEAREQYDSSLTQLRTLSESRVAPTAENLKALEEMRTRQQSEVNVLLDKLAAMTPPLEEITPERFQDRLRETVTNYVRDAGAANLELPKTFYMGFDPYQSTPPRPEAARYLARQLAATDFILRQLLAARVLTLKELTREPIPEESGQRSGAAATPAPNRNAGGALPSPAGKPGAGAPEGLMLKRTVEVNFFGTQASFQNFLNAIVSESRWFITPRQIIVKNEKNTGPSREPAPGANPADPAGTGAPSGTPNPDGSPAAPAKAFSFIVGEERVDVTVVLEVTLFDPTVLASKTPKPGTRK